MVTIGQQLTTPETGWQRFDIGDSNITFIGTWSALYGTSPNEEKGSAVAGSKMQFNFIGTKIRLLAESTTSYSDNMTIGIDGTVYNFVDNYNGGGIADYLVFEKTGLSNQEHYIEVTNNVNKWIYFNHIDIDDIGNLKTYRIIFNKFLIKQNNQYYSIKPEFYTNGNYSPLTLTSGNTYPNNNDYNNNGFDDVSALCTSTTVGNDTFRPIDKFGETKITGATFTTTDNKVYTINPIANKPFKKGSVICYSNGTVVTPDSINYDDGTVTFSTIQTGTMTFDYTYLYKFNIMMYKPS